LTHLSYALPNKKYDLMELKKGNRLNSEIGVLEGFGFKNCYIVGRTDDLHLLINKSAKETLKQDDRNSFEYLFYYSGLNTSNTQPDKNNLTLFNYPAYKFHHELQLDTNAITFADQGCSGLLSMINISKQILETSQKDSILCLVGDALPENSNREILYNLMSDSGASLIVKRGATENKIVHFYQETQSYYWDTENHPEEILASYFPMSERVITKCIKEAGLNIDDIKWFVPHNVSLRSWKILAGLLGIPEEKIWTKNISRIGHTISCDHIINLSDMQKENLIKKDDYVLLFTFGFGATWSCMILQH